VTVHIFATAGRSRFIAGAPMPPDVATCMVNGNAYSAESYGGAICELCRVLVVADVS
jgi:hypothetical protein